MKAAILSIGDELLIGQVINSNAATIGRILTEEGYQVTEIISIGDAEEQIRQVIDRLLSTNQVIISTGGLGPTHDDITKQVLIGMFGGQWVPSQDQMAIIKSIFERRGRTVSDLNKQQADYPSSSRPLINEIGTAPGLWFTRDQSDLFVLPGVPAEMKFLMENRVRPLLREKNPGRVIIQRTLRTTGIAESALAETIGPVSQFLPEGATLAFLPSFGGVRLRIMMAGTNRDLLSQQISQVADYLIQKAGIHYFAEGDADLEDVIVELLTRYQQTLSLAESCTGGLISDRITNVPGASAVYLAGMNTYSNDSKVKFLGVMPETLQMHGAVSEATAAEMAAGVRRETGSDFSLAVTGIAGPSGGTPEKPVGLVCLAVCSPSGHRTFRTIMHGDRRQFKERVASWALNHLRETILNQLKSLFSLPTFIPRRS